MAKDAVAASRRRRPGHVYAATAEDLFLFGLEATGRMMVAAPHMGLYPPPIDSDEAPWVDCPIALLDCHRCSMLHFSLVCWPNRGKLTSAPAVTQGRRAGWAAISVLQAGVPDDRSIEGDPATAPRRCATATPLAQPRRWRCPSPSFRKDETQTRCCSQPSRAVPLVAWSLAQLP